MTDFLAARHPVPVRIVLKGGRKETLAFRVETTPVEPRHASAGTMRPYAPGAQGEHVARLDGIHGETNPPLWESEGRLWTRAFRQPDARAEGRHDRVPQGVDDLVRILEAPPVWPNHASLDRLVTRSPLRGWHDCGGWEPGLGQARLGTVDLPEGRVVEDMGDEARHALRRFVEDRIRIVGDEVFVSFEGTHRVVMPPGDPERRTFARSVTTSPRHFVCHHATRGFLLRGDRPSSFTMGPPDSKFVPSELALHADGHPVGDDDVMAHLNDLPGRVTLAIARSSKVAREVDVEPLLRWAALGSIGGITAEDAREALHDVEFVADEAWMVARAVEAPFGFLGMALAYVQNVARPVLSEPGAALGPEDSEALMGMR